MALSTVFDWIFISLMKREATPHLVVEEKRAGA
jgi:hypothetical protein